MRRIRNTFEELNPSRHWKFESPISKAQCKDKYRKQFSCFHQIDISDIKNFFLRCEAWRYTKVGSTDQLDHERR